MSGRSRRRSSALRTQPSLVRTVSTVPKASPNTSRTGARTLADAAGRKDPAEFCRLEGQAVTVPIGLIHSISPNKLRVAQRWVGR